MNSLRTAACLRLISLALLISGGLMLCGCAPAGPDGQAPKSANVGPYNDLATAAAALCDAHISNMLGSLSIVAASARPASDELQFPKAIVAEMVNVISPELVWFARSGRWLKLKPQLSEIASRNVPAALWVADGEGRYYTVDGGLAKQTLTDRSYWPYLKAGRTIRGALVVSKSTGKKSAVVAVPIMGEGGVMQGPVMVGAVGASIYLEELGARIVAELGLRDDEIFFGIDETGETLMHRAASRLFENPAEQGSPSLARAIGRMRSYRWGTIEYEFDGSTRLCAFASTAITPWKIAVGKMEK
ncbi:MAG: cache domain-containing protein [Candidatus Brocadiia bacterium]